MTGAVLDRGFRAVHAASARPLGASDPSPGWRHLGVMVAVVLTAVLAIGGVIAVVSDRSGTGTRPHPMMSTPAPSAASATEPGQGGLVWHSPSVATPAGTPVQEEYDQALAQGLGDQPGMVTAASLAVPSPAISGGWPSLPVAYTPDGWAREFVSGLLDVDYARQHRDALARWLQAAESPESIPGVPSTVGDKVLYISLMDSGVFGGQASPVPPAGEWASDARAGVIQSVSELLVQPDPAWAQMVAAGWQPSDIRMTEEDVSGVLTVQRGQTVSVRHFALQLIVASGRWRDGYGSVAVGGWREG